MRQAAVWSVTAIAVLAGSADGALAPEEVAVIANGASEDSLALAETYLKTRGIPASNLIVVRTTAGYEVSRKDYESQIAEPVRQVLRERKLADKIRCLCVIWGVPVRVAGDGSGRAKALKSVYAAAARKAHYRLATDWQLLMQVGEKFPDVQDDGLEPLGKLFGGAAPAPSEPLPKIDDLHRKIIELLNQKQRLMANLPDQAKRAIALRQVMGVILDAYGAKALADFIAQTSPPGAPDAEDLRRRTSAATEGLAKVGQHPRPTGEHAEQELHHLQELGGTFLVAVHAARREQYLKLFTPGDASTDSELALLWWGEIDPIGQRPNLLHWRAAGKAPKDAPPTLMTARIDAPTAEDAGRMINDSLAAEKSGLKGVLYIDAGGKAPEYDGNLRALADLVRQNVSSERLKVVLDEGKTVFPPGSCPDAALYVGWYSLKKYVPAFAWKQGAVGWHIASFEAMSLRDPQSSEWCGKMIQNGAASTVGSVNEPYLQSFPLPQEFFPLLLTGKHTLAECYWRTVPSVSWRMTLIGDPLYNPFLTDPPLKAEALPAGLAP